MTGNERIQLAHEVKCSLQTVRRWEADPASVNGATRYALEGAAKKLKIDRNTQPENSTDTPPLAS